MGKHSIPLVIYTDDGERVVVGEADVEINPISQEMRAVGQVYNDNAKKFGVVEKVVPGMYSIGFDGADD